MHTGGCQCGGVRYEITGAPLALYVCHCRECRKQSASAFGMSLQIPRAGFRLVAGAPRTWSRPADSGRNVRCAFCPIAAPGCGTSAPDSEQITIKASSLDEAVDASAAIHIWTSRKLPGIAIPPGASRFPEEPA